MMQGARNARVEMIARIFAETGVKRLFKLILKLVTKHQQSERIVRLRNKFVPMDPRGWPEFDVTVSVGLGVGEKSEQIMQADSVIETMSLLLQSPFASMVAPENAYNAVKRKFNAAGIKDVEQYLTEPTEQGQQEPQPDPEVMKAQAEAEMQAAKMQHEQQMAQLRLELQAMEQQQKQQLAREQAEFEADLAAQKAVAEANLAREKMALEAELAQQKMQMEAAISIKQAEERAEAMDEMPSNRPGGSLAE